jgi:drug/metabolite transporter (DMT)-like permease
MGISPVFVRFAEVGPFTSAFWRVGLALPLLWIWARLDGGRAPWRPATVVAGMLFAGDLFFWHLAILNTTMANATLLATLAPVWVALGSSLFIGERVDRTTIVGIVLCVAGAVALVGTSWSFAPERLIGDLYGLATSVFFGAYFLAVRAARRTTPSGLLLYRSTLVTAAMLLVAAATLESDLWPATLGGAGALFMLAFVSHVGGQGLLAYALGHLSAAFSSLVIFLEAVAAAVLGWLVFSEALSPLQAVGGVTILAGIWIARPRPRSPANQ